MGFKILNQPPRPDTLVGAPLLEKDGKLNVLIFSYIGRDSIAILFGEG